MQFRQKSSDIWGIVFQEFIKNHHVRFFAKKFVVCQILDDFRNDHQTPMQYHVVFLRYFNFNCLRCNHSRRNETFAPFIRQESSVILVQTHRRKMKEPMAEYLEPGQTSYLVSHKISNHALTRRQMTYTTFAMWAEISRNILNNSQS